MLIQELIDYKFTQTDFIVIYYLNKQDLDISELIEKTGYSRDTINSTVKRLLENKMVERFEGENGKFIYRIPDDMYIDFYDYASRIIDYLIANHKGMMTPNICRIICYLLGYQAFNVAELIEDGWKPAATYNSVKKLLDEGIIEKDGQDYVFSKKLKNIARKPDVLQHVKIGTFNAMGYKHENTFEERFKKFLPIVRSAYIWGMQEIIPNAYPNLETDLLDYGYKVIYPKSYTEDNSKYMVAALVVADDYYDSYEPLSLGDDTIFNLRYTYGKLKVWNGRNLRILNVHVPQSCNVNAERKQEIKAFWDLIIKEAKACRQCDEEFLLVGDLNAYIDENEKSENADYLQRLSDLMFDMFEDWDLVDDYDGEESDFPEDWGYSWYSENGLTKRRLDYIFTNYSIIEGQWFTKSMDEFTIDNGISDHKAIVLGYHRAPTEEEIESGVRI